MTTQPLPSITNQQQAILKLLYKYRFLNRIQIQQLLKHKDKRRIISWLKDLRDKQYVDWHYDANDFIAKSQPAIYYLALNGIGYLRNQNEYPSEELRKRYREPTRTQTFINRCLLIADCCVTLQTQSSSDVSYTYVAEADYTNQDSDNSLNELKPHLFFTKQQSEITASYLLEMFDASLPRYQLRKRLKEYVEYLFDGEWKDSLDQAPVILFACPSTTDLLYIKRRIRKLLEDEGVEESDVRVTTTEKLKAGGIISRIWEEV